MLATGAGAGAVGWPVRDAFEAGGRPRPGVPGTTAVRVSRRRRDPAKRDAIFYAAIELFAARGFVGASMRDIATRAGVGLGTIYDYFPGKEAILLHFLREVLEYLCWTLDEARPAAADPVVSLRRALRMQVDYLGENPDVARIACEAARLGADGLAPLADLRARYRELLGAVVREGQEAGRLHPAMPGAVASDVIIGAVVASLVGWLGRGAPGSAVAALEPAIDLVLGGLGARGAARAIIPPAAGEASGGGE